MKIDIVIKTFVVQDEVPIKDRDIFSMINNLLFIVQTNSLIKITLIWSTNFTYRYVTDEIGQYDLINLINMIKLV